jgi:hypothetical protein
MITAALVAGDSGIIVLGLVEHPSSGKAWEVSGQETGKLPVFAWTI